MSSILFNKKKTQNLNFLTKNLEIWHEPLKTRNGYHNLDGYHKGSEKYQMKLFSPSRPKILLFNKFLTKLAQKKQKKQKQFIKQDLEIFHGTL